jgi:hypothetical protein
MYVAERRKINAGSDRHANYSVITIIHNKDINITQTTSARTSIYKKYSIYRSI